MTLTSTMLSLKFLHSQIGFNPESSFNAAVTVSGVISDVGQEDGLLLLPKNLNPIITIITIKTIKHPTPAAVDAFYLLDSFRSFLYFDFL